jgi:hypothetical protein
LIFLPLSAGVAQQQPAISAAAQSGGLSGKITAIDTSANTVVIEVPKDKQMFTVAGPLAPMGKLSKGGKSAKLSDFKPGDQVSVSYKSTPNGPVIQSLVAK